MAVAPVQVQGGERAADGFFAVQAIAPQPPLPFAEALGFHATRGSEPAGHRAGIEREVATRRQRPGHAKRRRVHGRLGRVVAGLREDEGHAGFIEQHAVGLVDERHAQAAQERRGAGRRAADAHGAQAQVGALVAAGDTVAQVIEGQLLGGAIGDVAGVGASARGDVCGLGHRAD